MKDITEVREHFKPKERVDVVAPAPAYLVQGRLYALALECSSTEEFLTRAESLTIEAPPEQRQDVEYWRNLALEAIREDWDV